jgi:hypothetical protein
MDDERQTPQQEPLSDTATDASEARVEEASAEHLSSWNRLVSTTNWEKGRIINDWRRALRAVGAPRSSYSDEAWSRRVGNVSPQHVGRLRRVYKQFHKTHDQYEGLFWTHFQAALDWEDAEMWLEGAVQNHWSVSAMRQNRWEALGAPADQKPRDEDIVFGELDEDVARADEQVPAQLSTEEDVRVQAVDAGPPPDAALDEPETLTPPDTREPEPLPEASALPDEPIRPFEDLPPLPADLHEAVEAMKLAILNHKMSGWHDVHRDDVLAVLSALKQLALAPSDD